MIRNLLALVFLVQLLVFTAHSQSMEAEPKTITYAKAKALIIPEIKFDKMSLSEAVDFFASESAAQDPAKKGLNFVLGKPSGTAEEPALNLNLKKIPLSDVLRYISAMTNYQVKYEENAIVLTPPEQVKKP